MCLGTSSSLPDLAVRLELQLIPDLAQEAVGPSGADVIKVVEKQPSLLLQTPSAHSPSKVGLHVFMNDLTLDAQKTWMVDQRQLPAGLAPMNGR